VLVELGLVGLVVIYLWLGIRLVLWRGRPTQIPAVTVEVGEGKAKTSTNISMT